MVTVPPEPLSPAPMEFGALSPLVAVTCVTVALMVIVPPEP